MATTRSKNSICSHHHSFALDNFFRRVVQSPKRILGPYLNKGDTVVDLGCGPGFFCLAMAELVGSSGSVFAVDLQREMLDRVQAKLKNVKDA
ncbi:MAG: methyltransferase domain-containing protein, partial [Desulfofustis sp.]